MLIEFRVSNFRSFREETAFSLVATADKTLADTNLVSKAGAGGLRGVLSAAIYGANASGKSNLVRAMAWMRSVVVTSANLQPGAPFNLQPHRFGKLAGENPSVFEVIFVKDDVRYQYGFKVSTTRVEEEWLIAFRTTQPQVWFRRQAGRDGQDETFKFGAHLHGARQVWRDATKANSLFLSTAIQLNSEQLRPVFEWFQRDLVVLEASAPVSDEATMRHLRSGADRQVARLLEAADVGISAVFSVNKWIAWKRAYDPGSLTVPQTEVIAESWVPEFQHGTGDDSVRMALEDESDGTQKLYRLAGLILDCLANGRVLVVDELDRSMHPLLVRRIVEAFHDKASNASGAQLVFTTHDTTLLDSGLFRRDQIWFVEKGTDHASTLFPLTDFSTRKQVALEKGYLQGRFGAVPILDALVR